MENPIHRPRKGFTLVELLSAIGIVALLTAILVPATTSVRRKSEAAKCMHNLKQIGSLMHLYAADQEGSLPPLYREGGNGSGLSWVDLLHPYEGGELESLNFQKNTKIYYCPTFLGTGSKFVASGYPTSFTVNGQIVKDVSGANSPVRLNTISRPGRTFLLVDGLPNDKGGRASINSFTQALPDGGSSRVNYSLHGHSANFLFVDGHVERVAEDSVGSSIYHDGDTLF